MRKISKALIIAAAVLTFAIPDVHAAPVQMTLTYDGKTHQYNAESIELRVNGVSVELPLMPPIILDGRTYVPSREVFEPLGATVDWKAASKELYIGYNGTLIVLKPDSKNADVNGVLLPLDAPAKIINDKLMIPARFVAEQLGIPVNWDPNNRIVSIGTQPSAPPITPSEPETPPATYAPSVPVASTDGVSVDISPQTLTQISGPAVNITGFKAEGNVFVVSASGQISRVDKLILPENKLVLDIYNSTNALSANSYASPGYSGVAAARNSQFQTTPEKITRIVFDLVGANKFSVAFGDDRKNIIVAFEENAVTNVSHSVAGVAEIVTLTCLRPPSVAGSRMFQPNRLVFDVPGTKYSAGITDQPINSRFVGTMRVSQFDAGTVRVVIDLNSDAQYNISYEGNNAVITLSEPTYKNIAYTQQPQTELTLKGAGTVDPALVAHSDGYLDKKYVLTLPGDYSGSFGYGTFDINDSVLNSIVIQNNNGKTELVFSQKSIMGYIVGNNGADLVIRPVNPKQLYKTVVYVDAGHGFKDPGAQAGGFMEKNLNLNIATRLYELLENDPEIKVYMSRLDDTYPENIDRARTANPVADLFLAVHHNAAENSKSNGTEVLYLNHEGEGYPGISSEAVARIIQTNLVRDIDTTDRGVVKRTNLIVLNQTTIPAVIVEVVFVTNAEDLARVSTPEGRQKVAESLYKSVKEIFRQYPTGR